MQEYVQVGLECFQGGRFPSKFGLNPKDQLGPGCWQGGVGMCEAVSCVDLGFCSFLPSLGNKNQQPWCVWVQFEALSVSVGSRICFRILPVCCWDAFPAAFCILSDPSRPGLVLIVPLLPGLRLGSPPSPLWDYAPQLKAGLFLVLGSVKAFLRTWNFHGKGWG